MNIDGASILVTGGCGLIGSTTIDLLLRDYNPARIVILDNMVRGSIANVAQALKDPRVTLVRGDIRDAATVHHAMAGMDAVIHMAALRITACAADPREAHGSDVRRQLQRRRGGPAGRRPEGARRVVSFDLRPGRNVPDPRRPSPLQQPDLVRRQQGHARGPAALVPRDVRAAVRGDALLQRLRTAHGPARQVHRGADPLDGPHRTRANRR